MFCYEILMLSGGGQVQIPLQASHEPGRPSCVIHLFVFRPPHCDADHKTNRWTSLKKWNQVTINDSAELDIMHVS